MQVFGLCGQFGLLLAVGAQHGEVNLIFRDDVLATLNGDDAVEWLTVVDASVRVLQDREVITHLITPRCFRSWAADEETPLSTVS